MITLITILLIIIITFFPRELIAQELLVNFESKVTTTAEPITEPLPQLKTLKPLIPVSLKRICSCESTGHPDREPQQFNSDGSLLWNKSGSSAVGACQIMSSVHRATALSLGHDIYTEEGNLGYAQYLFTREGSVPWASSQGCWR